MNSLLLHFCHIKLRTLKNEIIKCAIIQKKKGNDESDRHQSENKKILKGHQNNTCSHLST